MSLYFKILIRYYYYYTGVFVHCFGTYIRMMKLSCTFNRMIRFETEVVETYLNRSKTINEHVSRVNVAVLNSALHIQVIQSFDHAVGNVRKPAFGYFSIENKYLKD